MPNKFNLTHSFGARLKNRKSSKYDCGGGCERGIKKAKDWVRD